MPAQRIEVCSCHARCFARYRRVMKDRLVYARHVGLQKACLPWRYVVLYTASSAAAVPAGVRCGMVPHQEALKSSLSTSRPVIVARA